MKWSFTNLYRALAYAVTVLLFFVVLIVLTNCGETPARNDYDEQELHRIYATANSRIDTMQTAIAADLTAQAIKQGR